MFIQFTKCFNLSCTLLLAHGLFCSVLFNFQTFGNIPVFLLSSSSLISLYSEIALWNLYLFKFVEMCFTAQDMLLYVWGDFKVKYIATRDGEHSIGIY